ncbi:hypothetical protein [Lysobacter soli]|uniref:hypothetical protein n=1 Tax=Lysobacter soli TaxID=453783 RepID=UPI0024105423|nr:hypothetical protein [Lysobacter soli]MDG2517145.1 hypothetical protein [Lysobacter soli]
MTSFTRLIVALGLITALSTACAQTNRRTQALDAMQERLQAADANGDGYIDRAEADASMPRLAKNFAQLDKDGDDRLSKDELRQAAQALRQRRGR